MREAVRALAAKVLAKGKSLVAPGYKSYYAYLKHFRYECGRVGIHAFHGHRHLYAQERYRERSAQLHAARQDPRLMGDQMLQACEDFFAAECDAHPLLLVFEDLQWSDHSTVKFVDAIPKTASGKHRFTESRVSTGAV